MSPINIHQIYIFLISNCLAVLTEDLRYIALKFGPHYPISQNIPSSSNVTLNKKNQANMQRTDAPNILLNFRIYSEFVQDS